MYEGNDLLPLIDRLSAVFTARDEVGWLGTTWAKANVSTTYTALLTDTVIGCSTAGGAFTITLPALATCEGKVYIFRKNTADANAVTIDGDGTEAIDAGTTVTLTNLYETIALWSNGVNAWRVLWSYSGQSKTGTLFTQTASATVGNTTSETTLVSTGTGTATLPAGFWIVGKTVRLTAAGYWSQTASSPTRTIKIYNGATAVINTAISPFGSSVTSESWRVDALITCRTTGATGTVYAQGVIYLSGNATYGLVTTATVTIDTTASAALDVKWTWGTADVSNTITATNLSVEALN